MGLDTPSVPPNQTALSKSKKQKKKKTKAGGSKASTNASKSNGDKEPSVAGSDDDDAQEPNTESTPIDPMDPDNENMQSTDQPHSKGDENVPASNGIEHDKGSAVIPVSKESLEDSQWRDRALPNSTNKIEVAAPERDKLREEVTELRKSLESLRQRHEEETVSLKASVDEAQSGRDHAETRYQKLLGQVNTIKTQLGERLKADAAELSQARGQNEELEDEKRTLQENNEFLQAEVSKITSEKEQQAEEISTLRGRTNLSQQNWAKERDDLISREARAQEEFEAAKQAMQDWEVIATEERSLREGLSDRVGELEEQISTQRDAYERAVADRDSQSVTVDGLQRALQEVHDARKEERRELVESTQAQLEELRKQLKQAETSCTEARSTLDNSQQELERVQPFEKEVKEKNLLIGKLRHEAVILNDHLTKALRFLKKGKPEDNVDRQLVTNHLLHFFALERSDPKKFQVLQLISALLGWNDEQKESAGLSRPGASSSTNLRVPLSGPFRRVSSSASLSPASGSISATGFGGPGEMGLSSPSGKEGLAELWSEFLEREAQEGEKQSRSRRSSRPGSSAGISTPTGTGKGDLTSPTSTRDSPSGKPQKAKLEGLDEGAETESGPQQ
ncbi:MAG: hypothetical protein M1831_003318 [Alyxoria varia]|nr:MAG: hypothetical protein M1831_003318 [Alyxoria varia]